MGVCDALITADINSGCGNKGRAGLERIGALINWDDINWDTTISDPGMAKPKLKSGKKAFKVIQPSNKPFDGTKTNLVKGTYDNYFEHEVGLVVLGTGFECGKIIDELANGKFVLILETADKSGSGFQVYGIEQGLSIESAGSEKWNTDTKSGWPVVLKEGIAQSSYTAFGDFDGYSETLVEFNKLFVAAT